MWRGYQALDAMLGSNRSLLATEQLDLLSVPNVDRAIGFLKSYKPVREILPLVVDRD
jgi:hypothetical protein